MAGHCRVRTHDELRGLEVIKTGYSASLLSGAVTEYQQTWLMIV